MPDSRSKGKRGELELCERLTHAWPEAGRNLDQYGDHKQDVVNTPGVHWQCKRVERLNIWAALAQAGREAASTDLPVVAFRRNRGTWYAALALDDLVELLKGQQ